ncbi:hypothetical protein [Nocardia sp. NPDC056000]|uniref:hypothetical protein n=1 Tax=Nocardia sp. NPDC056000 TaxID=3345674 RepID=UPI0035DE6A57
MSDPLVSTLSRDVVRAAFPEELPAFDAVAGAYFKRGDRLLRRGRGSHDPLGFGLADVETIATAYTLVYANEIVKELGLLWLKRTGAQARTRFERFRRRRTPLPTPEQMREVLASLTPEQRAAILSVAGTATRKVGAPADLAERITYEMDLRLRAETDPDAP